MSRTGGSYATDAWHWSYLTELPNYETETTNQELRSWNAKIYFFFRTTLTFAKYFASSRSVTCPFCPSACLLPVGLTTRRRRCRHAASGAGRRRHVWPGLAGPVTARRGLCGLGSLQPPSPVAGPALLCVPETRLLLLAIWVPSRRMPRMPPKRPRVSDDDRWGKDVRRNSSTFHYGQCSKWACTVS